MHGTARMRFVAGAAVVALIVLASAFAALRAVACTLEQRAFFAGDAEGDTIPYARYYHGGKGAAATAWFLIHMAEIDSAEYTPYYRGALEWVMQKVERGSPRPKYTWRRYQGYGTAIYEPRDVANIGRVFLEAYNADSDTVYRHYAKGAANWLMDKACWPDTGRCYWPLHWPPQVPSDTLKIVYGVRYGIVSIADFFFNMWKTDPGDTTTYLPYAKNTAKFLMAVAKSDTVGEYYWPNASFSSSYTDSFFGNTCWCMGTAGIISLLDSLHVHFGEQDTMYSHYANGALRWLIRQAQIEGDYPPDQTQCWWFQKPAHEDSAYSPTLGRGAGGISETFLVSGDTSVVAPDTAWARKYREYATWAGNWDVAMAQSDTIPGRRWRCWYIKTSNPDYDTTAYYTEFCRGTPGVARLLAMLHEQKKTSSYEALVDSARKWMEGMMMADESSGTHTWPIQAGTREINCTWLDGIPGIGETMLELFRWSARQGDPDSLLFLALADTAAQWIVAEAVWDSAFGGYRWPRFLWADPYQVSVVKASAADTFSFGDTLYYHFCVNDMSVKSDTDTVFVWFDAFGQDNSFLPDSAPDFIVITDSLQQYLDENRGFVFREDALEEGWCTFNAYVGRHDASGGADTERGRPIDEDSFLFYYEKEE